VAVRVVETLVLSPGLIMVAVRDILEEAGGAGGAGGNESKHGLGGGGGGAGGTINQHTGGNGGSGVVIIKIPDGTKTATFTGGVTQTNSTDR
jgi:hypothetical protein